MIFVTLGTQDKSFKRLLTAIDRCIEENVIKEKVIVQAGHTKYKSDHMEIIDFIPKEDFESYIEKCSLLITHGGAGSILSAMKKNKKIIAVPRLSKYKEHTNDHQKQIINDLYNDGYILKCDDLKQLKETIKKTKKFTPKEYKTNNKLMLKTIEEYIEKTNNKNDAILVLIMLILILIIIIILIFK